LGALKDFIKARNPPTLEKAIQAAREEERVRKSNNESKKLFTGTSKASNFSKVKLTCFNCEKIGHSAKDCRSSKDQKSSKTPNRPFESGSRTIIVCNYCKKPGHTLTECRKRQYVNSKKTEN